METELRSAGIETEDFEVSATRLKQVIAGLDEEHRIVLSLYYLEGLSGPEIAQILGTSEEVFLDFFSAAMNTVRSHTRRSSERRAA
jgi:DNA-directed RNA polymerase specialized sigma24 family protein